MALFCPIKLPNASVVCPRDTKCKLESRNLSPIMRFERDVHQVSNYSVWVELCILIEYRTPLVSVRLFELCILNGFKCIMLQKHVI